MANTRGFLVDADYVTNSQTGESVIQVFFRTEKGLEDFYFPGFLPYLLVANVSSKTKAQILEKKFGETGFSVQRIDETVRTGKPMLQVFFKSTGELVMAREKLIEMGLDIFEFDIPFAKRFLVDSGLEPYSHYEIEFAESGKRKNVMKCSKTAKQTAFEPKMAAFDLEVYSPGRFPTAEKDEILMISLVSDAESIVFTTKAKLENKPGIVVCENEREMIEAFVQKLNSLDLDVLVTYNGDSFDLPYIKDRAKILSASAGIGFGKSEIQIKRRGLENAAKLRGIQHLDAYQAITLLNRFSVVNLVKKDLESVVAELFGVPKKKILPVQINAIWDSGEGLEDLILYNREDSLYTLKIAEKYLPILMELARTVRFSLFDINRSSASQIVEGLLLIKSRESNALVPNKPNEGQVSARLLQSMIGGFVKEPIPGLHENLAVLDFRSLYPSILVGHNISPDTYKGIAPKGTTGKNISPDGDWFAEKPEGFLVSTVRNLLEVRAKIKQEYKKADKSTPEGQLLFGRQWALKILLNSFYGTLAFAQFRWYSRESARAITAYARHYIQGVNSEAEKAGFRNIYSDTDSSFLLIPSGKSQNEVKKFAEQVNRTLPESMELEIENFYKRGIFVTKKDAKGGAAKKRYALIDYNNQLKIVGFEYVRRDWSMIAKKTQREVIEALLKEGNPKKSIEIVRESVQRLKSGLVPKKELVVLTQIKRRLDKYDSIGPHVAAAKKAVSRGKDISTGSVVGFIITKTGKSISDRAELEEFVAEGNYDADYYIHHQVLPAVIRILNELGCTEQDLLQGGKQSTLF